MPKMHQNTFAGQAPPGPAGELKRSPRPSRRTQRVLLLTALKKVAGAIWDYSPIKFGTRSALDVTVVCPLADSYVAAAAREHAQWHNWQLIGTSQVHQVG